MSLLPQLSRKTCPGQQAKFWIFWSSLLRQEPPADFPGVVTPQISKCGAPFRVKEPGEDWKTWGPRYGLTDSNLEGAGPMPGPTDAGRPSEQGKLCMTFGPTFKNKQWRAVGCGILRPIQAVASGGSTETPSLSYLLVFRYWGKGPGQDAVHIEQWQCHRSWSWARVLPVAADKATSWGFQHAAPAVDHWLRPWSGRLCHGRCSGWSPGEFAIQLNTAANVVFLWCCWVQPSQSTPVPKCFQFLAPAPSMKGAQLYCERQDGEGGRKFWGLLHLTTDSRPGQW